MYLSTGVFKLEHTRRSSIFLYENHAIEEQMELSDVLLDLLYLLPRRCKNVHNCGSPICDMLILPHAVIRQKNLQLQGTTIQGSRIARKVKVRVVACQSDKQPREKAVWQVRHAQSHCTATIWSGEGARIQFVELRVRQQCWREVLVITAMVQYVTAL